MAITRLRLDKQMPLSSSNRSLIITNTSNEAEYRAPTTGADSIFFWDDSAANWAHLTIGTNLSISGTTLNASAGAGGYATIQEEGSTVGGGNTTINFVGAGITAANAGGGVTSVTIDATLNALAGLDSSAGYLVMTGADTFAKRTLTGTTNNITVSNGDGTSGNPVFNIGSDVATLSGTQTFSGTKTFSNNITLNATPSAGTDVTNVTYVTTAIGNAIAGLRKGSVRAASLANGTLATAFENGDSLDGVTLATGDLILLKNQTAPAENGVYTVNASGAPTRATWMDSAAEIDGVYVAVEDGSQAGTLWITVSEVTTLNTDAITFTQIQTTGTIDGSGAANRFAYWSDSDSLTSNANFTLNGSVATMGTATAATSTILTTQGTGTGSSTFGYTHNNSSASAVFQVADDGTLSVGNSTPLSINNTTITRASNITLSTTSSGTLSITSAHSDPGAVRISTSNASGGTTIYNSSATASEPTLSVGGALQATKTSTSTNQSVVRVNATWAPSGAGTNTFTDLLVDPTINQTTHTGISRGIHILPTLTAASDFRGLEITATGQTALRTTAGGVRFDLGSDATGDMYYRAATTGFLTRIPIGSSSQVLIGGTTPSFAAVPYGITIAYLESSTSTTVDLDTGSSVKDRDGNNIAFTLPSNLDLLEVHRNGILLTRTGSLTTRDYSLNAGTNEITFTVALTADEIVTFRKPS